ncbi:MAG: hypothetical protein ACXWFN_08935 [Solirubrobacterales bacterium]
MRKQQAAARKVREAGTPRAELVRRGAATGVAEAARESVEGIRPRVAAQQERGDEGEQGDDRQ